MLPDISEETTSSVIITDLEGIRKTILMYLEKHPVILQNREQLADVIGHAKSIGAYNQPDNPVYIGSYDSGNNIFHYFQDDDGCFYFEDERCLQFDKEIKEHQKERRRKKWNRWT